MYNNITPRWRESELSLKEFQLLSKENRNKYIEDVLQLLDTEISFNDEYILTFYTKKYKEKAKKFLDFDEL